jgi:glutamate synthase (NADPH/NADH) large chain
VYNVDGNFSTLCNPEMVDLDPLNEEDIREMKDMISRHYTYTGSTVAKFVLEDFENQLRNFVKVFPKDYKKVLQEKKARVGVNS